MKYTNYIIAVTFSICAYFLLSLELEKSLVFALLTILLQQLKLSKLSDKYVYYKKLFKAYAEMYSKRLKGELYKEG